MSAFNSYAVCDIGFELSFAAVAGTLAGAELVRRRSARRASRDEEGRPRPLALRLASRLWDAVWEAGCITVCASAATFPVLVARGLSTSPYALLSGVAVLWLVQPMMVLGIAAALTGMVPALGPVYRACAWGAAFLVRLLNGWAEMVAAWPGAELAFDTSYAALVSLGLMGLCWLAFRWRVRARVWLPALALAAAVGVGAVGVAQPGRGPGRTGRRGRAPRRWCWPRTARRWSSTGAAAAAAARWSAGWPATARSRPSFWWTCGWTPPARTSPRPGGW